VGLEGSVFFWAVSRPAPVTPLCEDPKSVEAKGEPASSTCTTEEGIKWEVVIITIRVVAELIIGIRIPRATATLGRECVGVVQVTVVPVAF